MRFKPLIFLYSIIPSPWRLARASLTLAVAMVVCGSCKPPEVVFPWMQKAQAEGDNRRKRLELMSLKSASLHVVPAFCSSCFERWNWFWW